MNARPAVARRVLPGSPFNHVSAAVAPASRLEADDRVTHDRYGLGTVVGADETGTVRVDFGSGAVIRVGRGSLTKL